MSLFIISSEAMQKLINESGINGPYTNLLNPGAGKHVFTTDQLKEYMTYVFKRGVKAGGLYAIETIEAKSAIDYKDLFEKRTRERDVMRAKLDKYERDEIVMPQSRAVDGQELAHTDHPIRHYDRTCPACTRTVRTSPPIWEQGDDSDAQL